MFLLDPSSIFSPLILQLDQGTMKKNQPEQPRSFFHGLDKQNATWLRGHRVRLRREQWGSASPLSSPPHLAAFITARLKAMGGNYTGPLTCGVSLEKIPS